MTTVASQRGSSARQSRGNVAPYFFCNVAIAGGLCEVISADLGPTMIAVVGAWALSTAALRPDKRLAGKGFFAALTTALLVRNYAELTIGGRVWAVVLLLILAVPFVARPLGKTEGFPVLHFLCLTEGVYVYTSAFFATPTSALAPLFPPEVRETGFRTMSLFSAVLVGTTLMFEGLLNRRTVTRVEGGRRLSAAAIPRAYVLLAASTGLNMAITLTNLTGSLGSIAFAIQILMFGGWLILVCLLMDGNLPVTHLPTVILVPVLWVLLTLGQGALYQTATPGILLAALWISRRRMIPWAMLAIALVVLVSLNSQKGEFRQDKNKGEIAGTATDLTGTWVERTTSNLDTTTVENLTNSAYRFSNNDLLGYVATWVPDRYPYFGYEPYTSLPQVLVPRVILPDKPAFNFANQFGREYELINRSDYDTTVNMPIQLEAYVAGGPIFMVVMAIVFGLYLAILAIVFRSPAAANLIVAALISVQLSLSIESGVLSFLLIIPYALLFRVIMRWACGDERADEVDPDLVSGEPAP